MKKKRVYGKFNPFLFFIVIVFVGLVVFILFPLRETAEGEMMQRACKDVSEYSMFEASEDLHQVVEILKKHTVSPETESKDLIKRVEAKILEMEDEAKFHTNDIGYYRYNSARILNSLALSELINAKYYQEQGELKAARNCLIKSKHYLHDALLFLGHDHINEEQELLKQILRVDLDNPGHGQTLAELIETMKQFPLL